MPSSQTRLSVYNLALDLVGELPVLGETDQRPEVRWLNRNYDHTVETALRANVWSFAKEWFQLNADGDYDGWRPDWPYRYSLPNEALRMIPPTLYGRRGYPPLPYDMAGNKIFMSIGPAVPIAFIMWKPNPGEWDPLFVEVVRCSLAVGMAHRFTRKNSFLELALGLKDDAITVAEQTDAFEAGIDQPEVYDIIRARE